MENFNAKEYRDNLAKDLKDTRKTDPEKAQEILVNVQETNEYQKAESWQKEKREVMNEIGNEYIQKNIQFMVDATSHAQEKGFINLEFNPFIKKENTNLSKLTKEYIHTENNNKGNFFVIESQNKHIPRGGITDGVLYENYIVIKNAKDGSEIWKSSSLFNEVLKQYGYTMSTLKDSECPIREIKIISEDVDSVVFGYVMDNESKVKIVEFNNNSLKTIEDFDYEIVKEENLDGNIESKKDFDNFLKDYLESIGYKSQQVSTGDWYGSGQIREVAKFDSKELLPNVYGGFVKQEREEYNRIQSVSSIIQKARPIIAFSGKGIFIGDEITNIKYPVISSQNNGQVIISYEDAIFNKVIEGVYSSYKTTREVKKVFNILPDTKNIDSQENIEFWKNNARKEIGEAIDSLYKDYKKFHSYDTATIGPLHKEAYKLVHLLNEKMEKSSLTELDKKIIQRLFAKAINPDFPNQSKEIMDTVIKLKKGAGTTQEKDLSTSEDQILEDNGLKLGFENRKIDQVEYNNLLQKEVGEEKVLEKIKETKIDFYDNNKNFVDSLKEALENKDFKGLENIALVNIDSIGIDKTESLIRKDLNKEFVIYSFLSEEKIKSDNPKIALLLAKENVKFLGLPFTPDDLIRTINSEVIEKKDNEQNLQEIQDKEILNKVSQLLHKIHISSMDQFDTLPENEAKNLPKLISDAKEYFPALEGKTDKEIVEFLFQIRQNVPEVMKGQNIEGVYCDIEGTLFNGEELNQKTLNTLKELESQGKNITLWTDGDVSQLQTLLDKNGIDYPLKSKIDHAGASVEIVIDNDDQNTFSAKTKIFAKKFIKV